MSFSTILEQLLQDEERLQDAAARRKAPYASGWPVDENGIRSRGSTQAAAAGYQDVGEATPGQPQTYATIAQAVALELSDDLHADEIKRIRRDFALHNHPDLAADGERDAATLRMQIANLLIDDALRQVHATDGDRPTKSHAAGA